MTLTGRSGPLVLVAMALAGCATAPRPAHPADALMARLQSLCGQAFAGRISSPPVAADSDFAGKPLVIHLRGCRPDEVRVAFHVGDDRSRTFIITRTASGLRFKHDHRHPDGSPDALTLYGGDSDGRERADHADFPADAETLALFRRLGREASLTNVWSLTITPQQLSYQLARPPGPYQRLFRVDFDLTRPVPAPPPPWGANRRDGQ